MSDARPFLDYLREHRNGATHDKISAMMQELVEAVGQEGKAGFVTCKITVKPSDAGKGAVMLQMDVKATLPKPTEHSSIWFVTPDNNLVREDPAQSRLPLQEIGRGAAPRDIGPASAARALA